MNRRELVKLIAFFGLSNQLFSQNEPIKSSKIKPSPLKEGDKIVIISPATAVSSPDDIEKSIEILKKLKLNYEFGEFVKSGSGYKTRTIEERVSDLHEAFEDSSIKAVFCIRGGYGSASLLPYIDFDIIKDNPKMFFGYSDITALHLAINKMTGLVTYHSPVLLSSFTEFTFNNLKKIIFNENTENLIFENPIADKIRNPYPISVLKSGSGRGELIGGNLTLICSLIGTKWEPIFDYKILFFEDTAEEPYRIHRMLTQLKIANKFDKLKGIIIGKCTDCVSKSNNTWNIQKWRFTMKYSKILKFQYFMDY